MTSNSCLKVEQPRQIDMSGRTYYVATSLSRIDEANKVCLELDRLGMIRTFEWSIVPCEEYRRVSNLEISAVMDADIFIGLLSKSMGFNTELGVALAMKRQNPATRRVILYSPNKNEFCYLNSPEDRSNIFWSDVYAEWLTGTDPAIAIPNYLTEVAR